MCVSPKDVRKKDPTPESQKKRKNEERHLLLRYAKIEKNTNFPITVSHFTSPALNLFFIFLQCLQVAVKLNENCSLAWKT